ncbi:MAG TPA: hypothetical protein VFT41_10560 [Gemmatimonadaceae bacterium]|nr:hypothetical protein [Gemmatimonadaceae bacterium]
MEGLSLDEVARLEGYSSDLRQAWIVFLSRREWDWLATLTFRHEVHPEAADKRFRKWVAEINDRLYGRRWYERGLGVTYARGLEYQRRGVIHFHALLYGEGVEEQRREFWAKRWNELAGFARIEIPRDRCAVRRYVAKYVTKGGDIDIDAPRGRVIGF